MTDKIPSSEGSPHLDSKLTLLGFDDPHRVLLDDLFSIAVFAFDKRIAVNCCAVNESGIL